jgi:Activator of Hsp90 ATPase homolog 1-like protein
MQDGSPNIPGYDWTRFVQRVDVNCDQETAYHAWATSEGLEKWFLRKAIFTNAGMTTNPSDYVHKGDLYEWYWHGYSDESAERGVILEANGKDFISFVFGNAGNVTVTIKKEQNILIVELLQDKIPEDDHGQVNFHLGCSKGWVFYLANLKSVLEGGIDLRNKNLTLKNMLNA